MVILTCRCSKGVNAGGDSVLICQVPTAPSQLPPGTYKFSSGLGQNGLQFQWTGSQWTVPGSIETSYALQCAVETGDKSPATTVTRHVGSKRGRVKGSAVGYKKFSDEDRPQRFKNVYAIAAESCFP